MSSHKSAILESLEMLKAATGKPRLKASRHGPQWARPITSFKSKRGEGEEIKARAADLGVSKTALQKALRKGRLAALTDKHWQKLHNTDSWGVTDQQRKSLAKRYGRKLEPIDQGFERRAKMPAPMVVHRKGEAPYLVGGNTRLMTAYVRGIRPKVLHARLPASKKPKK